MGPPLHPAMTFGRVVPEPETGTDRGHAGRSSQLCTHEDQADRGTGFIETAVSTRWIWWSRLVGDLPPPQAESARVPARHSSAAARDEHTALMFADPTPGFTLHRQHRSSPERCFTVMIGLGGASTPTQRNRVMVTVRDVRERLLVPRATAEPYALAAANRTGHTVRNGRTWESRHRCRSAPPRTEAATWRLLARMLSPRASPGSGRALGRRSSAPGRSRGRDFRGRGDPWAAVVRATRCKPLATSELDEAVNAEQRRSGADTRCSIWLRRPSPAWPGGSLGSGERPARARPHRGSRA